MVLWNLLFGNTLMIFWVKYVSATASQRQSINYVCMATIGVMQINGHPNVDQIITFFGPRVTLDWQLPHMLIVFFLMWLDLISSDAQLSQTTGQPLGPYLRTRSGVRTVDVYLNHYWAINNGLRAIIVIYFWSFLLNSGTYTLISTS